MLYFVSHDNTYFSLEVLPMYSGGLTHDVKKTNHINYKSSLNYNTLEVHVRAIYVF